MDKKLKKQISQALALIKEWYKQHEEKDNQEQYSHLIAQVAKILSDLLK